MIPTDVTVDNNDERAYQTTTASSTATHTTMAYAALSGDGIDVVIWHCNDRLYTGEVVYAVSSSGSPNFVISIPERFLEMKCKMILRDRRVQGLFDDILIPNVNLRFHIVWYHNKINHRGRLVWTNIEIFFRNSQMEL